MDKFGRVDFQVEGLSMERLLNQCAQAGVRLFDVRRRSVRAVSASASPADYEALRAFAAERGWRVTTKRNAGVTRLKRLTRSRALLAFGVTAFMALCWYASMCLWFIDVSGAGAYEAEVMRILAAQGARPGRFAPLISASEIQRQIETELPGVSWTGVYKSGVRLHVQCVTADAAHSGGTAGKNIVASRDGVVHTVVCRAGTPKVKPGDTVRAGDVLIAGYERGPNDVSVAVRAEGSVVARVWHTGEAFVALSAERAEPTGKTCVRRILCTPDWRYAFETAPDYIQYEKETGTLPVGGALPVWVEKEIYRETKTVAETRGADEVKTEAGVAAMRAAREKAGWDAEIIDKWIDYSMIQEEGYRATAVLETLSEIARPSEGS